MSAGKTAVIHPAAHQIAAFAALPDHMGITVTQISARFGLGRGRDSLLRL